MRVRNLFSDEMVPDDLPIGFRQEDLTPDLVWVIENARHEVIGVLVAFAAHGFFMPIRVAMKPDAPKTALLRLLRDSFTDAKDRGLTNFLTLIDDGKFGQSMRRAVTRRGGMVFPIDCSWLGGKLESVTHDPTLMYPKAVGL